MSGFSMLWGKMLRSSIWVKGTKDERLLWVTFLMLKDHEGVVLSSMVGLADAAKLTQAECEAALKTLMDKDPDDSSGNEDGRRLLKVPGGWRVVNHDLYRFSTEAKRAFWAQQKAEQRARESERLKGQSQFEAGYVTEKRKRKKRTPKAQGQMAGAQQAIRDGFEQDGAAAADAHLARQEAINGAGESNRELSDSVRPKLDPETEKVLAELREQDDAGEGT